MTRTLPLLVVFVTACFHEIEPPSTPAATGTLTGLVRHVGTPGCDQPGPGCDGPAPDYEVSILAKNGTTIVATTRTDAAGTYTIALPAGDYTIFTQAGFHKENQQRHDVTVTTGNTAKVDLMIDTGVR